MTYIYFFSLSIDVYIITMDQPDHQENVLLEMMKQHISSGLPFQYVTNSMDQIVQQNSDGEISLNIEHEQDENEEMPLPVVYKKRARIKFTQEQLDALEATFQQHRYPTVDMVDDLVEQLNLPTQKITVWFQNRRARLKKSQQKFDDHQSFERDDQQQYDSGIHLDEDTSRASSASPPLNVFPHIPPIGYTPPSVPPPPPSPYYLPNPHQTFYNPMWQNFRYPFQSSIPSAPNFSYGFANYHSPFAFQDMSNYHRQTDFHGQNYEE